MIDRQDTGREGLSAVLARVVAAHFDPAGGSPYWLEQARRLGLNPSGDLRRLEDLPRLGPMDAEALASRPIEDFLPACQRGCRERFVVAETGGTLGRCKFAVHRDDEFREAFVTPFVAAARRVDFPRGENWLFVGPSGPHIIGKAARACAAALGSCDPFTVDFDPRWAKALPEGSFAAERYRKHIQQQALNVLAVQRVGVLFATPAVLEGLGEQMSPQQRLGIRGVHLGGMAATVAFRQRLAAAFPHATILSGYGNTLFGMMPELRFSEQTGTDYFPHGLRLVVQVIETGGDDADRLGRPVAYGQRGQVLVHRLDELQFIPNMLERDTAVRVAPPEGAEADGFLLDGLREVEPIVDAKTRPKIGLY